MRNSVMLIGKVSALIETKDRDTTRHGFRLFVADDRSFTAVCMLSDNLEKRRATIKNNNGVFIEENYRVAIDGKLRFKDGNVWIDVSDLFIIEKSVLITES